MGILKLNKTPVRTSRNFNINNIKIDNTVIPNIIGSFSNIKIKANDSKISVDETIANCDLVYGLGNVLTNQVKTKANKNLKITIDSRENQEIYIDFNFNEGNLNLVDYIEIVANEEAKATVVLKYESTELIEAFHNGVIKLLAKKDSKVNVIIVNLMNKNSYNFMTIENNLEDNAVANYTIVDFGGKNSITNYYSNLEGNKSDNKLNTVYLGSDNQLFDLNYIGELRGEKSNIDIEVQGALKDNAKKNFKGTIDFKKGCKKATGNENEACMLLSDTAKSIALPMLLCSEEDVEGNHSSSAGKIGEKELFYIMSRGFELKDAMKLMVRAKFNKILQNIENEVLKEQILNEIEKRLD